LGKLSAHWRDAKRVCDWVAPRVEMSVADWAFRWAAWLGNLLAALRADHSDAIWTGSMGEHLARNWVAWMAALWTDAKAPRWEILTVVHWDETKVGQWVAARDLPWELNSDCTTAGQMARYWADLMADKLEQTMGPQTACATDLHWVDWMVVHWAESKDCKKAAPRDMPMVGWKAFLEAEWKASESADLLVEDSASKTERCWAD
jgi:hypothetical protein